MEFFDKLGKKATQAYKITADKTGKIAKETKLKLKMNDLKSQINDVYVEIGKKVYEKHVTEEEISIEKDLDEKCTKIDVLSDEIDTLLKQCLDLKDKKLCQKCFKEIDKQAKFCPICGAKQKDTKPREVEVLEKLENTEIKEENKKEAEKVKENLKKEVKDSEGAKKTKKTNSGKEKSKENKEKGKDKEKEKEEANLEKTVEIESNVETKKEKK